MHPKTPAGRTILVCTTFRDFTGGANDPIQHLFLESLKRQTHTNWLCVITLFGEKNVAATLQKEGIPHVLCNGDARGERWSMSEVVQNGIKTLPQYPNSILMWTTCDVIFDDTFFAEMDRRMGPMTSGTSYPHIVYPSVEACRARKGGSYFWSGIDTNFVTSDMFADPRAREAFTKYPSYGWGATEFYFMAFGKIFGKNMLNFFPLMISKVENDRVVTNETRAVLQAANQRNGASVQRMADDYGIKQPMKLWFLWYRFAPLAIIPARPYIWFMVRFRVHLLGVRYHLRRLLRRA